MNTLLILTLATLMCFSTNSNTTEAQSPSLNATQTEDLSIKSKSVNDKNPINRLLSSIPNQIHLRLFSPTDVYNSIRYVYSTIGHGIAGGLIYNSTVVARKALSVASKIGDAGILSFKISHQILNTVNSSKDFIFTKLNYCNSDEQR